MFEPINMMWIPRASEAVVTEAEHKQVLFGPLAQLFDNHTHMLPMLDVQFNM